MIRWLFRKSFWLLCGDGEGRPGQCPTGLIYLTPCSTLPPSSRPAWKRGSCCLGSHGQVCPQGSCVSRGRTEQAFFPL